MNDASVLFNSLEPSRYLCRFFSQYYPSSTEHEHDIKIIGPCLHGSVSPAWLALWARESGTPGFHDVVYLFVFFMEKRIFSRKFLS